MVIFLKFKYKFVIEILKGIQVGHQSFNSPTSLASQGIYNQSQQFGALQQGMSQVGNPQAMNQDSLLYQTQFINQNNTSGYFCK